MSFVVVKHSLIGQIYLIADKNSDRVVVTLGIDLLDEIRDQLPKFLGLLGDVTDIDDAVSFSEQSSCEWSFLLRLLP